MIIILPIIAAIVMGICWFRFYQSISLSSDGSDPKDCFGRGEISLPTPNIKVKILVAITKRLQNVQYQTK